MILLRVLLKRHPSRYQNKRVPECLVFKFKELAILKTRHFDTLWVLLSLLRYNPIALSVQEKYRREAAFWRVSRYRVVSQ